MTWHPPTTVSSRSLPAARPTGPALWVWFLAPGCCSAHAEAACCASGMPTHSHLWANSEATTVPSTVSLLTATKCSQHQSGSQWNSHGSFGLGAAFVQWVTLCCVIFFDQRPHCKDLGSQRIPRGWCLLITCLLGPDLKDLVPLTSFKWGNDPPSTES